MKKPLAPELPDTGPSFREFATAWTSGELALSARALSLTIARGVVGLTRGYWCSCYFAPEHVNTRCPSGHALERGPECAFGLVAERAGYRTNRFPPRQAASGEQHTPACQIFDGPFTNQGRKPR